MKQSCHVSMELPPETLCVIPELCFDAFYVAARVTASERCYIRRRRCVRFLPYARDRNSPFAARPVDWFHKLQDNREAQTCNQTGMHMRHYQGI